MITSRTRIAFGVVAALTTTVLALQITSRGPNNPMQRLARLNRGPHVRRIEPRIVGLPYAGELPSRWRAESMAGATTPDERKEAAELMAADDAHTAATAALLSGEVDIARRGFETLARQHPNDPNRWSDVSAVRLVAAMRRNDSVGLLDALVAADSALWLRPNHPEALFNRGVILERLGIEAAALAAYKRSIPVEPGSAWADEARARASRLRHKTAAQRWTIAEKELTLAVSKSDSSRVREIVAAFPQDARASAETLYLAAWGEETLAGSRDAATRHLALASAVGDALVANSGETLLRDVVKDIRKDNASNRIALLASSFQAYIGGRQKYRDRDVGAAYAFFLQADRGFTRSGNPMRGMSQYYLASCLYDSNRTDESEQLLRRLLAETPAEHQALRAQLLWEYATVLARRGRLYESLWRQQESVRAFERLREEANIVDMISAAAGTQSVLGQRGEAWSARGRVFTRISRNGDRPAMQRAVDLAARTERLAGRWEQAYSLQEVALEPAFRVNPRLYASGMVWQALTAHRLGRARSAAAHLSAARQAAVRIRDASLRERTLLEISLIDAVIVRSSDPRRAEKLATEYIDQSTAGGSSLLLPEALLERGRALRDLGDRAAAITDLRRATELLRLRRTSDQQNEFRDAFFETSTALALELTALLVERGDVLGAWNVIDDARTAPFRSFGTAAPAAQGLPPRAAIVMYAVGERLMIFVRTHRGVQLIASEATPDVLEQTCARFTKSLDADLGRRCSSLLIAPIENVLASVDRLSIIPDRSFFDVPFAALSTSRGLLIEQAVLTAAPSPSLALGMVTRAARTIPSRIVAVGNPAIDRQQFPELAPLPDAEREARALALLYPQHTILTGRDATSARVAAAIEPGGVLHLGTHAIFTADDPRRSFLVLAPSGPDSSGALHLSEIQSRPFRSVTLVVLAGCSTGGTSTADTHVGNLALAFLAAGASRAVATLWDVDDDVAAWFATSLHRRIRSGASAAEAVRETQLAMLHSNNKRLNDPKAWAAFQTYGPDEKP